MVRAVRRWLRASTRRPLAAQELAVAQLGSGSFEWTPGPPVVLEAPLVVRGRDLDVPEEGLAVGGPRLGPRRTGGHREGRKRSQPLTSLVSLACLYRDLDPVQRREQADAGADDATQVLHGDAWFSGRRFRHGPRPVEGVLGHHHRMQRQHLLGGGQVRGQVLGVAPVGGEQRQPAQRQRRHVGLPGLPGEPGGLACVCRSGEPVTEQDLGQGQPLQGWKHVPQCAGGPGERHGP